MKKGLFVVSVLALAMSAVLFLRPDPWTVAKDYARQNAAELIALVPKNDLIGVRVAEHGALLQLALWDASGTVLYPLPDSFSPLKNELDQYDLNDVRAVLTEADETIWTPFDREGRQVLYCQRAPAACLIYDRAELAALLGFVNLDTQSARIRHGAAVALAMASAALAGLALWRQRQQKPVSAGFELLPEQFSARRDGREIQLTKRDTKLLVLLQARAGTVVTRDELYDEGWGREFMPNSRALDQHIINLRRKLDPNKDHPELIETVRGIGYRFVG